MIDATGSINLSVPTGPPRVIRTKNLIQKVKNRLKCKRKVSSRKMAQDFDVSRTTVRRILKEDLGCYAYKKRIEPLMTNAQKDKRKKFANWIRTNFTKEQTLRFVFSDEKMFDIDGIYNSQNDRIWACDRREADEKGGRKQERKLPQKVMVWLAVCSKGVSPMVIFGKDSVDHERYIEEVLPVALKFGNKCFGNDWTFQQDGARPRIHIKTQQWCAEYFPSFFDKDHWPPNSPDLNLLDYSIWDEFAHQMNLDRVQSKKTLIEELKRAVKKIRETVVFESCNSFTNRLYRLKKKILVTYENKKYMIL